ncbi:MAG: hypothetical protein ACOC88_04435 [Candidatus Bipolaricaulota bacterium]
MNIQVLGAESLGVRGLCVYVMTDTCRVVIDPGVALGYRRHGLLPHPFQVAVGAVVRQNIVNALRGATDVVISHFHGDHVPLADANPYQMPLASVSGSLLSLRVWGPARSGLDPKMASRRDDIAMVPGEGILAADGREECPLSFSSPMPHGEYDNGLGDVILTRIEAGGRVFVHASDIQLLESKPIRQIVDWEPDIVLTGGPPLYLPQLGEQSRKAAWKNAQKLSRNVPALLIDHHLLRSRGGVRWLKKLNDKSENYVGCAADYMDRAPAFLEAWRETLYAEMKVPDGWHKAYSRGQVDTAGYRKWRGWDMSGSLPL